jgi:hypothetical protein
MRPGGRAWPAAPRPPRPVEPRAVTPPHGRLVAEPRPPRVPDPSCAPSARRPVGRSRVRCMTTSDPQRLVVTSRRRAHGLLRTVGGTAESANVLTTWAVAPPWGRSDVTLAAEISRNCRIGTRSVRRRHRAGGRTVKPARSDGSMASSPQMTRSGRRYDPSPTGRLRAAGRRRGTRLRRGSPEVGAPGLT